MNAKLKKILRSAWNEPRHFFLSLAFLSLAALGLGYAINVSTPHIQLSQAIKSIAWTCAVLLVIAAVVGILGFLLSWIPLLHRFFGWILKRRLFVLACLATIVALIYVEENWRGRRAWNQYRKQFEARGEQLDFKAFIPKPIPDEQNFAATPFIQSWFQHTTNVQNGSSSFSFSWNDAFVAADRIIETKKDKTNKAERAFVDLVAWQRAFDAVRAGETNSNTKIVPEKRDRKSREQAAPAVLEGLKTSMTNFAELHAASKRPHSQFPVDYMMDNPWGMLLPHLAQMKAVCQRLNVQACAELAAGQSENALENIKLILHMADSVKDEPFLVSYLVRLACVHIATQPVWEGLADHRWSDAQLQAIQTQFRRFDFFRDLNLPLDSERAMGILTVDLIKDDRKLVQLLGLVDSEGRAGTYSPALWMMTTKLIPNGWYDFEKLNYLRLFERQLEGSIDLTQKRVFPEIIAANSKILEREISPRGSIMKHHLLASFLLPALGKLPYKAAEGHVVADQVALACALERYRLANGEFPGQLAALVPKFISEIPHDPFVGKSYEYRRADDGQFILYSVGRNENDDSGAPGKTLFNDTQGDLVWRYPAN